MFPKILKSNSVCQFARGQLKQKCVSNKEIKRIIAIGVDIHARSSPARWKPRQSAAALQNEKQATKYIIQLAVGFNEDSVFKQKLHFTAENERQQN